MNNQQRSKRQSNMFVTLLVILMTVAVVVAIAGAVAKNTSKPDKRTKTAEETKFSGDNALREDMVHDAEDEVTNAPHQKKSDTPDEKTDALTKNEDTAEINYGTKPTEKNPEDAFAEETPPELSMPVSGEIQKDYSMEVPVFSLTMEDFRTHNGIDIFAEPGSEVTAAADGTVSEVWDDAMMGKSVSVTHAGNAVTTYKNLGDQLPDGIEKGAQVHAGDIIGTVGDTALEEIAEESHLHFEMTVDGIAVNPQDYIDKQ